jgi:hypothetical protein
MGMSEFEARFAALSGGGGAGPLPPSSDGPPPLSDAVTKAAARSAMRRDEDEARDQLAQAGSGDGEDNDYLLDEIARLKRENERLSASKLDLLDRSKGRHRDSKKHTF